MTALCLAGAGVVTRLALAAFTLSWSHTIEHTRWDEIWRVLPDRLVLETARVEGSGAGMEPGSGARLIDGAWEWHPHMTLPEIVLRRAAQAGDWRLCTGADDCRALGTLLPDDADPVRIYPCA